MNSKRLIQLRDLVGYDDERLSRMLGIPVSEVVDFGLGRKPVPESIASQLEQFVDWASEVGDTTVKKELAQKHLSTV